MNLNARAIRRAEALLALAEERRVAAHPIEGGGRFVDCGIAARGGLAAGLDLARICLADLADVAILPGDVAGRPCPMVQVATDHPVAACLGSQYAGWALSEGKYFAMGSGPMRAAYAHEPPLCPPRPGPSGPEAVVGVLEGRKFPGAAIVAKVADACHVGHSAVTLHGCPDGEPRRLACRWSPGRSRPPCTSSTRLTSTSPASSPPTASPRSRPSPRTTSPRSAGPMTRSSTGPASSSS